MYLTSGFKKPLIAKRDIRVWKWVAETKTLMEETGRVFVDNTSEAIDVDKIKYVDAWRRIPIETNNTLKCVFN